jgi:ATP-dependent DNA helicase RecQ
VFPNGVMISGRHISHPRCDSALESPPVLALTATATPEFIEDILNQLAIDDVFNLGIERKNLFVEGLSNSERGGKVCEALEHPRLVCTTDLGSFVPTDCQANFLWQWLCREGIGTGCYHGKMKANHKSRYKGIHI